eukprot:CAMPEP_0118720516 /NCGR_PEP_ID=MMETSP0800-20121206/30152_1 /TAXON_ID=210618 ORGANISM="Striatella unipunctata, Strain CCMP2910" /NCGR_SAMPLE_ID=MMETSP0800 /ASSEMBLY_ACC=CAM_ASM_000638 /LENGTH=179 /DNA_ID=CAMNT_0006628161 /DNA_START=13 /DNA_END=552 /DNA_ORIENTATION=-
MALVSVAIIGKDGEPLFLQDYEGSKEVKRNTDNGFGLDSSFGLAGEGLLPFELEDASSLRHQFLIHGSLDRFEELADPKKKWRPQGASGSNAMWVGLLYPVENLRLYGYLTSTGVKIIVAVEEVFMPDGDKQQKTKIDSVKFLMASIHAAFVEHVLNPFSQPKVVEEVLQQHCSSCTKF